MKWKVVWKPEAERSLTLIWLSSRQREAINIGVHELDSALSINPNAVGESREENRRVAFVRPLGARIELDQAARTVSVLTVWEY
jgi:hypothetical protein